MGITCFGNKTFGERLLESLVVVVNQFPNISEDNYMQLKYYIQDELEIVLNQCKSCVNVRIPVVLIDAKRPKEQDINIMYSEINKVNPYYSYHHIRLTLFRYSHFG